jgi:cell wall assembly regulator SMI1
VQKFTRPITREIELGGERLALTLDQKGISVRVLGTRNKPPRELTWGAVLSLLGRQKTAAAEPTAEELAAAIKALKTPPAPAAEKAPAAPAQGGTTTGEGDPVKDLLTRLEQWLKEHRPRYLKALRPGATAAELDALQTALGVPVPDGLRKLLAWHNGQAGDFVGCFEGSWRLLGTDRIASLHRELLANADNGWERSLIPFLEDDRDNCVFLDGGQAEAPVRAYWQVTKQRPVLAPSLAAWLKDFVEAVLRGEYTQDPERGDFLRSS